MTQHAPEPSDVQTRRQFLTSAVVTTAAATGIAGCLEGPGGGGIEEGTGYAAFFALADWGNIVGGDAVTFENPVEVGQMGHGWDPDFDAVSRAARRQVFLYLDTPEFAWAQNVADTLKNEHEEVTVVDAMDAIPQRELIGFGGERAASPTPDRDHDFDPEAFTVGGFDLVEPRENEVSAWWHEDHWHGGLPDIPEDDTIEVTAFIEDNDGRVPPIGEDEPFQLIARVAEGAPTDIIDITVDGVGIEISGLSTGQTIVTFELRAGDDVIFDTADDPLIARVVEPDAVERDMFYDPHVWVDPVLAEMMIEEIASVLSELDPANADYFTENAEQYLEDVRAVDASMREIVDEADHSTVVFAGHSSFGYIEHRYDLEFYTPVGATPDADVTLSDVSHLARAIEAHDIDTILYDPFEAPDPDDELPPAVEVLLENTSATQYAPLTPAEGTTPQWEAEGYGWLEQWTEINLPAFRQALST